LRGHFEVHEEVFAVLAGHGRGEQGRGEETNGECESRPISEHIGWERFHREEHGSGHSEQMDDQRRGRSPGIFRQSGHSRSMMLSARSSAWRVAHSFAHLAMNGVRYSRKVAIERGPHISHATHRTERDVWATGR
jgi:hypothetical protein